jgi:hypothetical protein
MARLFTTGGETGGREWNGVDDFTTGSSSANTLTSSTLFLRSGARSLRYFFTGGVSISFRQVFDQDETALFGRIALYIDSAFTSSFSLIQFRDSNNATQVYLRYDLGTSTVSWHNGAGTLLALGNIIVPSATWIVLEFEVVCDASGSLTTKINGSTDAVFSGDTDHTNQGAIRSVYIGALSTSATGVIHLDDIAINNDEGDYENSWVGLGGTFWLRPTADGAINDWTPSAGTANWDMVDDVPPNTTDYVQALDPDELDLYEVQDCPDYIARIRLVQVLYRAALATSGENYLRDVIRVDGTNYEGPTFTIVPIIPSFTLYKGETHYINPDTEAGWQVAEVDDLQAGFEIDEAPS